MLRELGPDNPTTDGICCLVGSVFFLICGLSYKRMSNFFYRRDGQSDDHKEIALANAPLMCYLGSAVSLLFALMSFFG